ncbi:MAG: adenylosuccinate synthase [Nanoarchaeota archaeon]|nr:adenylosuccinate synthase [Nanoarchaeota archaeon]
MKLEKLTNGKQVIAVVCNQWGDTGKGKLVDWLASEWADVVVRGTGGGNAGHTMKVGEMVHVGHTVPCGILNPDVFNYIGNGVAFDPRGVCEEFDELAGKKIDTRNLRVAYNAKLILPQHLVMDRVKEAAASGGEKIGTTGRGIGPVYTDHYARVGLTVNDMMNKDVLARKVRKNLKDKLVLLDRVDRNVLRKIMQHDHLERGIFFDQKSIFDVDAIIERYSEYGKRLEPLVSDVDAMVREAVADGMKILLEGAQGHMLSIDYGSYPFVTSSDCSIPGLAKGSGLSEKAVDSVLGVVKAPYMTRVGEGPFPTEMGGKKSADWCSSHTRADEEALVHTDMNHDDPFRQGVAVRIAGGEYGATTGRPRRTGWLDLPLLRAAMLVNGNQIALTKLQVFDGAGEVRICDSYTYNGPEYFYACQRIEEGFRFRVAPSDVDVLQHCEPNYVTLPGWKGPTENIRSYEKLPKSLRNLVGFVEANTGARVRVLSMGPERSQTIVR